MKGHEGGGAHAGNGSAPAQARRSARSRGTNGSGAAPASGAAHGANGSAPEPELLPLIVEKESTHPCFGCAKCCHYVAIEIDRPSTPKEYDYLVWYLIHPGVSVFVDWNGDWFVKFESRCRHLTPQGLCGIYEERPAICRDFDWQDCEMHVQDEPPDKWIFETADAFLAWLEKQRPTAYRRFQQWKRERARKKGDAALRRVKVTRAPAPPAG